MLTYITLACNILPTLDVTSGKTEG